MCAYLCLSLSLSFCSSFSLLRRKVNVHTLVDDILAWKMAKDRYIYQAQLFPCFKSWSLELQQISCVILLYKKMRGSKRTNLWMPNAICKHIYNQKGSQGSDRCLQNHLEIFKKLVYLSPFSQNSDQAISLRYRIVYLFKKEKKKVLGKSEAHSKLGTSDNAAFSQLANCFSCLSLHNRLPKLRCLAQYTFQISQSGGLVQAQLNPFFFSSSHKIALNIWTGLCSFLELRILAQALRIQGRILCDCRMEVPIGDQLS